MFYIILLNSTLILFLRKSLLTEVTALSQNMIHFFSNLFNLFFLTFYVYVQFASFLFFYFKCNSFWHFCYIFLFFLYFFFNYFWEPAVFEFSFFPFILLLTMIPGANTKKSADDITSNDRGEDEGIFWFFSKLNPDAWT